MEDQYKFDKWLRKHYSMKNLRNDDWARFMRNEIENEMSEADVEDLYESYIDDTT